MPPSGQVGSGRSPVEHYWIAPREQVQCCTSARHCKGCLTLCQGPQPDIPVGRGTDCCVRGEMQPEACHGHQAKWEETGRDVEGGALRPGLERRERAEVVTTRYEPAVPVLLRITYGVPTRPDAEAVGKGRECSGFRTSRIRLSSCVVAGHDRPGWAANTTKGVAPSFGYDGATPNAIAYG